MPMRSWLFVPADSARKLARAAEAGADAVVLDLEDGVAPGSGPIARVQAQDWLHARRKAAGAGPQGWVRINPIAGPRWRDDLAAIMPAAPAGIVVPKVNAPEEMRVLGAALHDAEHRHGLPPNSTRIMPMLGESPAAALGIGQFALPQHAIPRLAALTWGAEDLASAIGASGRRDAMGDWDEPLRFVRTQVLLAAHACKLAPIDTVMADFRDSAGLRRAARRARSQGFAGMLAIHPDQVPVINEAFSPSEAEIARALAIVDTFAARPNAGVLDLDGEMIELPHLAAARRLLDSAS